MFTGVARRHDRVCVAGAVVPVGHVRSAGPSGSCLRPFLGALVNATLPASVVLLGLAGAHTVPSAYGNCGRGPLGRRGTSWARRRSGRGRRLRRVRVRARRDPEPVLLVPVLLTLGTAPLRAGIAVSQRGAAARGRRRLVRLPPDWPDRPASAARCSAVSPQPRGHCRRSGGHRASTLRGCGGSWRWPASQRGCSSWFARSFERTDQVGVVRPRPARRIPLLLQRPLMPMSGRPETTARPRRRRGPR